MGARSSERGVTLPEILKEVKRTVAVYLTPEGIELMRTTPFVRKEGYIACREVYDSEDPNYLYLDVRYYTDNPSIPRYMYIGIPHRYVLYLTAETPPARMQKQPRQKQPG